MKKALVGGLVLALVAGAGYVAVTRWRAQGAAPAATAPAAAPVKAAGPVSAEGRVVPVRSALLSFPAGGVVAEVLVREGDQVKAGQVIARLANERQQAAVAQAEAELRRAQARLAEVKAGSRPQEIAAARAALEQARAALDKLRQGASAAEIASAEAAVARAQARLAAEQLKLNPQLREVEAAAADLAAAKAQLARLRQGPTPAEIAQAEAQVKQAQAQLDLKLAGARPEAVAAAEADLAAAQSHVEQARAALAETELRAPFAGTVAALDVKPGQYIAPGAPAARLADLSAWHVETEDLTELKVARLQEGTPARITLDALPGVELTGKVALIRPMGEKKQGDVVYTVVVKPDQPSERLRWNMTAAVTFEGN